MESNGELAWREIVQVHHGINRARAFGPLSRLHVAHSAAINDSFFNLSGGEVYIGEWANLAHDVMFLTGAHDYRKRGPARPESGAHNPDWPWGPRDIHIEDGVWIGSRAILIGPVTVGSHAVVCAGAVVVKDVAPWTMVGGNPARFIKHIEEIP